ncbi:3-phosphoshikimate 1-carboxyvinyltransferase [Faecalicatena contorta]|uniref:3-phosphoshikimate 1-carboxyvinyltransferase n=1 Tax=Faecalicatena contorta TaxID=39482 RepID=UPI001F1B7941|nr:3-phosphoshikimate 1-carboxyvinyltransferase [Faecalicatena contorta]MCF2679967.1 3-phosphoshikimate 1-carboxyvinyltransferase [Faecalicatena contorta]
MSVRKINPVKSIRGEIMIPGDKSISHRSVMFGSIALGTTEITNFLEGADCLSTIGCFQSMGINIERKGASLFVHGKGMRGLTAPQNTLDVGNSGTTTRLMSGILSGQNFASVMSGDASLNSRPMRRIMTPLNSMGAHITSLNGNNCAPLKIEPGTLHGIDYSSPVASAQVKSAVLLAGLYADGETSVTEPALSRNHTELMLKSFGAQVTSKTHENGSATAHILPCTELYGQKITVPGDISSAAYFIAAALIVPDSELLVKNVGTNPTRDGFLRVCKAMGADITMINSCVQGGEERADILVRSSNLKGTVIEGDLIPTLIDEIPVIAVMAANAEGTTVIRDAAELKVKETNRIDTVVSNLQAMGGNITPTEDGMIIEGGTPLKGAHIQSFLDHRIAMSFAIAGINAQGETTIENAQCVDVSYPEFFTTLEKCCL